MSGHENRRASSFSSFGTPITGNNMRGRLSPPPSSRTTTPVLPPYDDEDDEEVRGSLDLLERLTAAGNAQPSNQGTPPLMTSSTTGTSLPSLPEPLPSLPPMTWPPYLGRRDLPPLPLVDEPRDSVVEAPNLEMDPFFRAPPSSSSHDGTESFATHNQQAESQLFERGNQGPLFNPGGTLQEQVPRSSFSTNVPDRFESQVSLDSQPETGSNFSRHELANDHELPEPSTLDPRAPPFIPRTATSIFPTRLTTLSMEQQLQNAPNVPQQHPGATPPPTSEPTSSIGRTNLGVEIGERPKGKGKKKIIKSVDTIAEWRRLRHNATQRAHRERKLKRIEEMEERLRALKEERAIVSAEIASLRAENQRLLSRPPFSHPHPGPSMREHPETTELFEDHPTPEDDSSHSERLSLTSVGFGRSASFPLPSEHDPPGLVSRNSEPILTTHTMESPMRIRTSFSLPNTPSLAMAPIPLLETSMSPALSLPETSAFQGDTSRTSYFDLILDGTTEDEDIDENEDDKYGK